MPRMTLAEAKFFQVGRLLYNHIEKNRDGTPLRARVNGRLKSWSRPHTPQWQLPMKHGFKNCFYINETTMWDWFTNEQEAILFHKGYCIHACKHNPLSDTVNYWFITSGNMHLPEHFPTFEEALAHAATHQSGCKEPALA